MVVDLLHQNVGVGKDRPELGKSVLKQGFQNVPGGLGSNSGKANKVCRRFCFDPATVRQFAPLPKIGLHFGFPRRDFVVEGHLRSIGGERVKFFVSAEILDPLYKWDLPLGIDPNAWMTFSAVGTNEPLLDHLLKVVLISSGHPSIIVRIAPACKHYVQVMHTIRQARGIQSAGLVALKASP